MRRMSKSHQGNAERRVNFNVERESRFIVTAANKIWLQLDGVDRVLPWAHSSLGLAVSNESVVVGILVETYRKRSVPR